MNERIMALCLTGILSGTSCTAVRGNRNEGTFSLTSVGGNVDGLDLSPDGAKMASMNNSVAFKDATAVIEAMYKSYMTFAGLRYSLGQYYNNQNKIVAADKAVKIEELRNAKTISQGEQALDALRITHVPVTP